MHKRVRSTLGVAVVMTLASGLMHDCYGPQMGLTIATHVLTGIAWITVVLTAMAVVEIPR